MHEHDGAKIDRKRLPATHAILDSAVASAGAVQALRAGLPPSLAGITALQRAAGNAAVASALDELDGSLVHGVVGGGGQPLDPGVQHLMEAHLGADLSSVRVHTDSQATQSAQAINAHAYTAGDHVVFQRDQYDPNSSDGLHMLAHELTHVVQQRSGPVSGTPVAGGISVSDPGDRFEQEADRSADTIMRSLGGGIDAFLDGDGDDADDV